MILTVDIGNSRIKWASWQTGKIVAGGAASHQQGSYVDVFDALFAVLEKPAQIYVACVAGENLSQALSGWCRQHWQLDVEFLKTEKQFKDIKNAYDDPRQHGVDRWAAVVAAHLAYPGFSACVINAGTAITFDFINKNGQHLGGYILPSYITMRKSLLADTANVMSAVEEPLYNDHVPDNTSDAVNQGLHKLLRAGIREICQFATQKMDSPMQIIISGGYAEAILAYPDMPAMKREPDLVMQGLYSLMTQRGR
jgi:type III pantothenate kinase